MDVCDGFNTSTTIIIRTVTALFTFNLTKNIYMCRNNCMYVVYIYICIIGSRNIS